MSARRRVVVTGLGAVTPVGNDVATTWRALLDGHSGGAPITKFDASGFEVRFACEVKGFDAAQYMDRKEAKRADLYTQYALAAAVHGAGGEAGLVGAPLHRLRTQVTIARVDVPSALCADVDTAADARRFGIGPLGTEAPRA